MNGYVFIKTRATTVRVFLTTLLFRSNSLLSMIDVYIFFCAAKGSVLDNSKHIDKTGDVNYPQFENNDLRKRHLHNYVQITT